MSFSISFILCFYSSFTISAFVQLPANPVVLSKDLTLSDTTPDLYRPRNLSHITNGTSARGLTIWPPTYPGNPYVYRLDPHDASGIGGLAFLQYGRTGGPETFDLLLTLLGKVISSASRWEPRSYLDGRIQYRLPESEMTLIISGDKPNNHGQEALTGARCIAITEALRALVSAYGAREFAMLAFTGNRSARKKFGAFWLEGPFPDYAL